MLARGQTSKITIDMQKGIVIKYIIAYHSYNVFEREVYWLKYLNEKGYDWCPKLLSSDPEKKTIHMSYVGNPITKSNAPQDWVAQLEKILNDLEKEDIKHNDIKKGEVLVYNGKLYLVDYGWSSKGNDWSCGGIISKKPKPCHSFHDHTAIKRIEKYLKIIT